MAWQEKVKDHWGRNTKINSVADFIQCYACTIRLHNYKFNLLELKQLFEDCIEELERQCALFKNSDRKDDELFRESMVFRTTQINLIVDLMYSVKNNIASNNE